MPTGSAHTGTGLSRNGSVLLPPSNTAETAFCRCSLHTSVLLATERSFICVHHSLLNRTSADGINALFHLLPFQAVW